MKNLVTECYEFLSEENNLQLPLIDTNKVHELVTHIGKPFSVFFENAPEKYIDYGGWYHPKSGKYIRITYYEAHESTASEFLRNPKIYSTKDSPTVFDFEGRFSRSISYTSMWMLDFVRFSKFGNTFFIEGELANLKPFLRNLVKEVRQISLVKDLGITVDTNELVGKKEFHTWTLEDWDSNSSSFDFKTEFKSSKDFTIESDGTIPSALKAFIG